MENLQTHLEARKKEKGYIFIPYLAAGDPNWKASVELVDALIASGADTIELGLPFTDPIADGPVLQRAFKRVIANDFTLERFFTFLDTIHKRHPDFPFVVMGYANIFHSQGYGKILAKLLRYNVLGVIIPDIPVEEKQRIIEKYTLANILKKMAWIDFITPTATPERLRMVGRSAGGFLYFVSTKGVTGQEFNIAPWKKLIAMTRKICHSPVLIGFGIRKKEHVAQTLKVADGFIIGSRIHEIIENNLNDTAKIVAELKREIKSLLPPRA